LLKLANKHKIVDDILAFRELTKLKSTYGRAAADDQPENRTGAYQLRPGRGRHRAAQLQQTPLQNIPIRTERAGNPEGLHSRSEEFVLLSADYSQIELRIVAAISADPNMCDAFRQVRYPYRYRAKYSVEERTHQGNALQGQKASTSVSSTAREHSPGDNLASADGGERDHR